ncbi:uncharacterized protein LOC143032664 [Oratosquilla oratoria]|uniref:uncharacterized protein LOC143032664 n=1 Tax=Oratosquilla oratoria TaxID=337810 RepID=UPI003F7629CC
MKDRNIPTSVRIVIYKSILRPILTNGCESWTLATKTSSKVQAAEMRALRLIKGVTRFDHIRNDAIRQELEVESILEFVERAQLRCLDMLNEWIRREPRRDGFIGHQPASDPLDDQEKDL